MEEGFVLVSNIPAECHTADLRRFFSDYVENEKLSCFHYRHRTEKKRSDETEEGDKKSVGPQQSFSRQVTGRVHRMREEAAPPRPTCCCLVKLPSDLVQEFTSSFHRKHWLDSNDCELTTICLIAKISTTEQRDLSSLPELRPPNIMPRGNVGTSTKFFLDAIRECRLPSKLIGKLKLEFPKGKHKKYGSVPFQYEMKEGRVLSVDRAKLQAMNAAGPSIDTPKDDSDPDDDDDTCEEWERHEALHNDVQANRTIGRQVNSTSYLAENGDLEQQAGTKQKPYEDEIELVWEKGGSGLNFYTDAQYWKAQEGDFDEQTTDDWDVDMSVYYEKDTRHDKDAEDRFSMRRSEFLRSGKHEESVFKKSEPGGSRSQPGGSRQRKRAHKSGIGAFEVHTRGFGGKIMKQSGWKEGMGLGARGTGIKIALDGEEDGQPSRDRKGFGYHGEKVVFAPPRPKPPVAQTPPPPGHRISTAYTRVEDLDPAERLERTNPALYLKFRDQPIKFLSGGTFGGENSKK